MISTVLLITTLLVFGPLFVISAMEVRKETPSNKILKTTTFVTRVVAIANLLYSANTLWFLGPSMFNFYFFKEYMESGRYDERGIVHTFVACIMLMMANAIGSNIKDTKINVKEVKE